MPPPRVVSTTSSPDLTGDIVAALTRRADGERAFHIEDIQDQAELALMRSGHQKVARAYVLYREERAKERAAQQALATRGRGAKADDAPRRWHRAAAR